MKTVTSKDGTTIAYDQTGQGPVLVLVGGMFEQRAFESETAQLAALPLMAQNFTVIHYDRRGRGDSTDTQPYSVQREIEDIEALIDANGGSVYIFGISSGAALAYEAAAALGSKVKKLALYEPPYNDDAEGRQGWRKFRQDLQQTLAEGRRGDAVILFMQLVGMPEEHVAGMRESPIFPMFEGIAPTIAYDAAVLGEEAAVPVGKASSVTAPALLMAGSESFPFMPVSAEALAKAMPNAKYRTLEGQTHEVAVDVLGPVLVEFFKSN